jgi:hypothetical protein
MSCVIRGNHIIPTLCPKACALLKHASFSCFPQASSANIERARSLTWAEAMKSGEAPLPQQQHEDDGSYDGPSSSDSPDVHQLARAVRTKRLEVSARQQIWNEAVEVSRQVPEVMVLHFADRFVGAVTVMQGSCRHVCVVAKLAVCSSL